MPHTLDTNNKYSSPDNFKGSGLVKMRLNSSKKVSFEKNNDGIFASIEDYQKNKQNGNKQDKVSSIEDNYFSNNQKQI